jgi:hypothetical protein
LCSKHRTHSRLYFLEEGFLAREDAQQRGVGLGKKQEGGHQEQEIK